jgi:hypothetical protein
VHRPTGWGVVERIVVMKLVAKLESVLATVDVAYGFRVDARAVVIAVAASVVIFDEFVGSRVISGCGWIVLNQKESVF